MPTKQEVKQKVKDKSVNQQKQKGSGSWKLSGGEKFIEWKASSKEKKKFAFCLFPFCPAEKYCKHQRGKNDPLKQHIVILLVKPYIAHIRQGQSLIHS